MRKLTLFEMLPVIPDLRNTEELRFLCQAHGANARETLAMAAELNAEMDREQAGSVAGK